MRVGSWLGPLLKSKFGRINYLTELKTSKVCTIRQFKLSLTTSTEKSQGANPQGFVSRD